MKIIDNVQIMGIDESMKAHQYSFKADTDDVGEKWNVFEKCAKAPIGSGHNNALKGIVVQFDLTFTIKAWTEAERYHWFDIVMSQSTMHTITKFDLNKQYHPLVDKRVIAVMKDMINEYNTVDKWWSHNDELIYTKDEWRRTKMLQILYTNPCGMYLTARMSTNYLQLKTIYHQRRFHRLPEWRTFCEWIESLPHSDLITEVKNA